MAVWAVAIMMAVSKMTVMMTGGHLRSDYCNTNV